MPAIFRRVGQIQIERSIAHLLDRRRVAPDIGAHHLEIDPVLQQGGFGPPLHHIVEPLEGERWRVELCDRVDRIAVEHRQLEGRLGAAVVVGPDHQIVRGLWIVALVLGQEVVADGVGPRRSR